MTEETKTPEVKVPTRPGSQWATGRRKRQDAPQEKPGFRQGALVNPRAAQSASLQKPKQRPSRNRQGGSR